MIDKLQFVEDDGPKNIHIFYSYLLLDAKFKNIIVFDAVTLKNRFTEEYRNTKKEHNHLTKEFFNEAFGKDLIRSYFYIKNKYFNETVDMNEIKEIR